MRILFIARFTIINLTTSAVRVVRAKTANESRPGEKRRADGERSEKGKNIFIILKKNRKRGRARAHEHTHDTLGRRATTFYFENATAAAAVAAAAVHANALLSERTSREG